MAFQCLISATLILQEVLVTELSSPTSIGTKTTSSIMTTDQCDYDCTPENDCTGSQFIMLMLALRLTSQYLK